MSLSWICTRLHGRHGLGRTGGDARYGDQIDELAELMRAAVYCLIVATREASLSSRIGAGAKLLSAIIIYVAASPTQCAPKQIVVPRYTDVWLKSRMSAPRVHGDVRLRQLSCRLELGWA